MEAEPLAEAVELGGARVTIFVVVDIIKNGGRNDWRGSDPGPGAEQT